jgi:hypothetical protein
MVVSEEDPVSKSQGLPTVMRDLRFGQVLEARCQDSPGRRPDN